MLSPETLIKVTNRSSGLVVYSIPERRIRREFNARETKVVPYQEIIDVCMQPGGRYLVYNYLAIDKIEEAAQDLGMKIEREYFIKENEIDSWMQTCSIEEFQDALDFAPEGVKDLIKKHAVSLPLTDLRKCDAIKNQLHFNVLDAIKHEKEVTEDDENEQKPVTGQRRVQENAAEPTRRATPKYKVVGREDKEV